MDLERIWGLQPLPQHSYKGPRLTQQVTALQDTRVCGGPRGFSSAQPLQKELTRCKP